LGVSAEREATNGNEEVRTIVWTAKHDHAYEATEFRSPPFLEQVCEKALGDEATLTMGNEYIWGRGRDMKCKVRVKILRTILDGRNHTLEIEPHQAGRVIKGEKGELAAQWPSSQQP
jgi:hypothetical protein